MRNNSSYPYKFRIGLTFMIMAFFGFGAAFMASLAIRNETGFIINHVIHLSPNSATVFYWIISLCSALFVLFALRMFFRDIGEKREVLLTSQSITAPKIGSSNQLITINYKDIETVFIDEISGNQFLKIFSPNQKLVIPHVMLTKNNFDKLINELAIRIKLAKQEAD